MRNLNDERELNDVDLEQMRKIWHPVIIFSNSLGLFQTQVDKFTRGTILKETEPLEMDTSLAWEGRYTVNIVCFLVGGAAQPD